MNRLHFHFNAASYNWVIFLPKLAVSFGNQCFVEGGDTVKFYGIEFGLLNFDIVIGFIKTLES
jgi:hypothetical protein